MPTLARLTPLPLPPVEHLLKRTRSRCPVCHDPCPAEVVRAGASPGEVFLRRTCPRHGVATLRIASDARFHWLAKGDPANAECGCDGIACRSSDGAAAGTLGRNATRPVESSFERRATCLALIEVVHSCNLACPTCYADSPVGAEHRVDAPSLEDLVERIESVITRKGRIEILQLSGGEPTLHPRFLELLEWTLSHPRIDYVLINTNGVRIARDAEFVDGLRERFRRGKVQLYLQFDGPGEAGQRALRGADLRATRVKAIERCAAFGLPITLAMTVTPENLAQLWATIEFGLQWPHVRGVSFQPEFLSGRVRPPAVPMHADAPAGIVPSSIDPPPRLNVADIILAAVGQSEGRLRHEDFTPLPCGDPNCATIGYLLKVEGGVRSISDFVDFRQVQDFLRDKVRYQPSDLERCGCESEPLAALLKQFELDESHAFRLFIKPFMDSWSWDEDRIDRCCTHVIRPDGQLDSFCRYYSRR